MEENLLRETGVALGVALVFLYTGFKKAKKSGKNAGVAALWGVGQAVGLRAFQRDQRIFWTVGNGGARQAKLQSLGGLFFC